MTTKKTNKKAKVQVMNVNENTALGLLLEHFCDTTQEEQQNEQVIADAEFVEIERAHKSSIIYDIKRRAANLDRFQNGRSSKFNADKYIYRKLLNLVSLEDLEALNAELKTKLSRLA